MKKISGGVCAAKGFTAAGIHAGVKAGSNPEKNDLALILSDCECAAAATFTNNRVKAAPVYTTMNHLENGILHGIIVNSGNANACAPNGPEHAEAMCAAVAAVTGRQAEDFAVASTGVIGVELNIKAIQDSVPALASALSIGGSNAAAEAIMTTDTVMKEIAIETTIGGKIVRLGAICKGAGMICPNMGTMLCFITSDCAITSDMLFSALHEVVPRTFNRVTVDGDTSTNDACVVLCNGSAGNPLIDWKDDNYNIFKDALMYVCTDTWPVPSPPTAKAPATCSPAPSAAPAAKRRQNVWPRPWSAPTWSRPLCSAQTPTGAVSCALWATPERPSVPTGWTPPSTPAPAASRSARTAPPWSLTKTWPRKFCPRKRSASSSTSTKATAPPPAGAVT